MAQRLEVLDRHRVCEPRVGAAQVLGYAGQLRGEPAHVRLVDDRAVPGHVRARAGRPWVGQDDAVADVAGGVQLAARTPLDRGERGVDLVPVHLRAQPEVAGHAARIWVEQQLGRVVPQSGVGVPAPVHPQPVALPGGDVGNVALPDAVAGAVQGEAPLGEPGGGLLVGVEQAQLDRGGVGGEDSDVHPAGAQVGAEGQGSVRDATCHGLLGHEWHPGGGGGDAHRAGDYRTVPDGHRHAAPRR